MERQNQINRTLSQPEAVEYIRSILSFSQDIPRTVLVNHLCDTFGFFDPRGERQSAGYRKALRELERKKHIVLPRPGKLRGKRSPRRLAEGVAAAQGVPGDVSEIREIRLLRVETEDQMRIFMIQGHPRGAGAIGRAPALLSGEVRAWVAGRSRI